MKATPAARRFLTEQCAKAKTALLRFGCLFAFTKRDRRVISILLVLLASTLVLRAWNVFRPVKDYLPAPQEQEALALIGATGSKTGKGKGHAPRNPAARNSADSSFSRKSRYVPPAYMKKRQFRVDLNKADTFDLQEIRGIGPVYARRIVKHRERLGGFARLEQLREVWGIDSLLYLRMLPSVYLEAPVYRKIDLNKADIRTLRNHPYLDYYQAKEIYLHRRNYGPFSDISQLRHVNLIDSGTYSRLEPYLQAGTAEETN